MRLLCFVGLWLLATLVYATEPVASVETLAGRLTGHFSSLEQSKKQPDYFDIHLRAVRIWNDRPDGPWIYLEQARGDAPHRPYRQRVYRLERLDDGTFASHVYELPDPAAVIGAWADQGKLQGLTPQQLKPRDGCTVYLTFDPASDTFKGGTRGTGCASSLAGADHATSEVAIDANGMSTWDRGYDKQGRQVWGAEVGPYRFDRVE